MKQSEVFTHAVNWIPLMPQLDGCCGCILYTVSLLQV